MRTMNYYKGILLGVFVGVLTGFFVFSFALMGGRWSWSIIILLISMTIECLVAILSYQHIRHVSNFFIMTTISSLSALYSLMGLSGNEILLLIIPAKSLIAFIISINWPNKMNSHN
jgi:hypothetical protein